MVLVDVIRNSPDTLSGHTGRQDQPIAIQHPPTVGRQLKRTGKPHLTLSLEKIIANHLHIRGTRAQPHKAQPRQATMNLLRQTGVLLASNGLAW
jgi:hypothetical protein